ncbi:MAG: putative regulatory protein FmdB family [Phycisphaerales bacterium]|nr:putative regulatory protein FmdB family [Phycisphaerales bacterium]
MPTYEYKCSACGHAFEKFQSIKAAPIKKCPECGKSKVKRLIGMGAGLLFKGSGFYITDYRGDSYSKAAKADVAPTTTGSETKPAADAPATPKTDAKSETKSESKPEPKSEPKAEAKPAEPKTASRSAKKR